MPAALAARVTECLGERAQVVDRHDQVTVEVSADNLIEVATTLRDDESLAFTMLMDLAAVDYSEFGKADWKTSESATRYGYSRGVERGEHASSGWSGSRFAVVYHLLSLTQNERLRMRVQCAGEPPVVPSILDVWASADWFEREAFDLFGVHFQVTLTFVGSSLTTDLWAIHSVKTSRSSVTSNRALTQRKAGWSTSRFQSNLEP